MIKITEVFNTDTTIKLGMYYHNCQVVGVYRLCVYTHY